MTMHITGAISQPVFNRGAPPESFLSELLTWGHKADDSIFAPRKDDPGETDIYTYLRPVLGPWQSPIHRRAVMLEVLRVLAGFESSWRWDCGRDVTNSTSVTPTTVEAGAWQVSGNSRTFGADLRALAPADGNQFQRAMKQDRELAMEYIARLLRHTVRHNGPVLRREIDPHLSREAVAQFMILLS